jgi:hypothetical protein
MVMRSAILRHMPDLAVEVNEGRIAIVQTDPDDPSREQTVTIDVGQVDTLVAWLLEARAEITSEE